MTKIIYCGAEGQYEAVVDDIDYDYLTQWKWNCFVTLYGMIYARRKDNTRRNGKGNIGVTVLMHVAVIERKGDIRPSRVHTVDHRNRDTLYNTRGNLIWATKLEQNLNRTLPLSISRLTLSNMGDYPKPSV